MTRKPLAEGLSFYLGSLNIMRFSWFSFSSEKSLAGDLVAQLIADLPPTLMETRRKVISVNKITRLLERTYESVGTYQNQHRLGFIGRAVLANQFKWALKNSGYPEDFVDMATEGLVVHFSRPHNAKK